MTESPEAAGSQQLLQSPLHEAHVAAGAKFAEFAGWSMPLEYEGVVAEHLAVRNGVGLFDVSHLGTILVTGPGAVDDLNRILTNDLRRIGPGQAQYTLLCDPDGEVIDDLIVYVFAPDDVLLIPNAGNAEAVLAVVSAGVSATVTVTDSHRDTAIIAVQGPDARELLADLGLPTDMDYMGVSRVEGKHGSCIVCRTGYTGERGYELLVPASSAVPLWELLLSAGARFGVRPCGLGARDTLRTEMGYPLHGQDLGGDIGPVEARLGWAVGWDKGEFGGRAALLAKRGSPLLPRIRSLVLLERGVPRPGGTVHRHPGGPIVGRVTSGTFSPGLKVGIAMALVDFDLVDGDEVVVNIRGRWLPARVTPAPLVPAGVR